jgi:hypothetical protein
MFGVIAVSGCCVDGAVVAAIWGYHTYTDTKEKEFYSVFWNKKLSLFLETSSAASTMATTESINEFNNARTKYWELFFGRLSLIEGDAVKKAMESFSSSIPTGLGQEDQLPLVSLQQPAYKLTIALKRELGIAWRDPFGEL